MRTPVTTIAALLLFTLFSTSCQKNKFNCVCAPKEGEVRRYDVRASTRKNAMHDCKDYELKLGTVQDVFTCQLAQ